MKNRRASGGQLPRRSSGPGFSRKWTADGTRRGASSGSLASSFRQTAGSSTRRGLPRDSSQRATPEFVVPRSSAQPDIRRIIEEEEPYRRLRGLRGIAVAG